MFRFISSRLTLILGFLAIVGLLVALGAQGAQANPNVVNPQRTLPGEAWTQPQPPVYPGAVNRGLVAPAPEETPAPTAAQTPNATVPPASETSVPTQPPPVQTPPGGITPPTSNCQFPVRVCDPTVPPSTPAPCSPRVCPPPATPTVPPVVTPPPVGTPTPVGATPVPTPGACVCGETWSADDRAKAAAPAISGVLVDWIWDWDE